MIADVKEHLERIFTPEKLATIKKLVSTWTSGPEPFTVLIRKSSAFEEVYVEIIDPRGAYYNGQYNPARMAWFSLSELPGNGDVLVSHDVNVERRYRGCGVGTLLHADRLEAAKASGASCIFCTVAASNESERAILFKHGWKEMGSYKNKFGDHTVEFWKMDLPRKEG